MDASASTVSLCVHPQQRAPSAWLTLSLRRQRTINEGPANSEFAGRRTQVDGAHRISWERRSHVSPAHAVAKFADHLPLCWQEVIFARAGLAIPRSTLSQQVGTCGVRPRPLVERATRRTAQTALANLGRESRNGSE
jgi:Transposase IS66 family